MISFSSHNTNGTTTTTVHTEVKSMMLEVIVLEFLEFLQAAGFDEIDTISVLDTAGNRFSTSGDYDGE